MNTKAFGRTLLAMTNSFASVKLGMPMIPTLFQFRKTSLERQQQWDIRIPRKISSICSIFIRCSDTIHCTVNGRRRYSLDLLQGGLEVPCILTFAAKEHKEGDKTKKLLESVLGIKCMCLTSDKEDGELESQEKAEERNTSPSKVLVSVIENENFLPKFHQSEFEVDLTGSQNEKSPPRKKQKNLIKKQLYWEKNYLIWKSILCKNY